MTAQSPLPKKVHETTSQQKKLGVVAFICHFNYDRKCKIGASWSRIVWEKARLYSKIIRTERAGAYLRS
jgi:hypothetical protein